MFGSLCVLAVALIVVFGWYSRLKAIDAAIAKANTDLIMGMEIINLIDPGSWNAQDGILYKGKTQVSYNTELVDYLAGLTSDAVTLFLGDTCVATTVRSANGDRVIGTKVSDIVAQTVLKNGQIYRDAANVADEFFQTVYAPIRDVNGNIIGIFEVGIPKSFVQQYGILSSIRLALLGLGVTIFISLVSWFFIQKVVMSPLHEMTIGKRDPALEQANEKVKVINLKEISDLTVTFNQIVERFESLADEISKVTMPKVSKGEYVPSADVNMESVPSVDARVEEPDGILSELIKQCCLGQQEGLPKGLNQLTLKQIIFFLCETNEPVSAENVAEGVSLTRVTVRRYLEFLEQCGFLSTELKYGTVGRPVKLFQPVRDFARQSDKNNCDNC
jgi:methyl-accepting chemotaxis protein